MKKLLKELISEQFIDSVKVDIGEDRDFFPRSITLDEPVDIDIPTGDGTNCLEAIDAMLNAPSVPNAAEDTLRTDSLEAVVRELKRTNKKQESPCYSKEADRICELHRFERWGEILYMAIKDKFWRAIPSETKANEILRSLVKRKYRTAQGIREVFADIYSNAVRMPRYGILSAEEVYIGFPDLTLNIRSGKTLEHSLNHRLTFLLAIYYKDLSRNERNQDVVSFLKKLCGGDTDMLLRLRDLLCLALLNITFFKIVYLVGGEGGGRIVLLQMLEAILGQDNVAYLSFVDMTRNYRLFHTIGKACNLSFEEGDQVITNIDTLKKYAQGAGVNTDRKYGEALDFIPQTKIYCGGAHLPNIAHGRLEGLAHELEIVRLAPTCTLDFQQRQKLMKGVSYFASWLVNGALELAERDFQIQVAEGCAISEQYSEYDGFLNQHIVASPNAQIHSSEISDLYREEHGISTLSARERTQLQGRVQHNFGVEMSKSIRKNGKVSSGYKGIDIQVDGGEDYD